MPDESKQPENEPLPSKPEENLAESESEEPEEERVEQFSEEFDRFFARGMPDSQSWIGVGLDGTLAFLDGPLNPEQIGKPVPDMVARVRDWMDHGHTVKIFTPRACEEEGVALVEQWIKEHGLPELEVTCEKDLHMLELWDNRAIQIIANTGKPVGESRVERDRPRPGPGAYAEDEKEP